MSQLRPAIVVVCVLVTSMSITATASAGAPVVEGEGEDEWVTDVSASSARLQANVDPNGDATTYKFEYESIGGEVVTSAEGDAGSGAEGVIVQSHPQNLEPATAYHFRVVINNKVGKAQGVDRSFTTQPAEGQLALPDSRMWELVSPATKDGALIVPSEEHGGLVQAAESGQAITYLSFGPVVENPAGNSDATQVLSVRNRSGGWSTRDITTPHKVSSGISFNSGQEYKFFSTELSTGLVEPLGSGEAGTESEGATQLSPGASELTVYLHANAPLTAETSGRGTYAFDEATREGGYLPLVSGCPQSGEECEPGVQNRANVLPLGTQFGGRIEFEGSTADLSHIVLHSAVPLTEKTPAGKPNEKGGLYEWADGQLQLVSILPEGEQGRGMDLGGAGERDATEAISSDGSRIIMWSAENEDLFMRNVSSQPEQTIQLDAIQGGSGSGGFPDAEFQFASNNGQEVFFTDDIQLTSNSTAAEREPDLYECEMVETAGKLSCALKDLTVDLGGHADVRATVLAGADNKSYIYFVAKDSLPGAERNARGESPEVSKDNLYMLHYDEEDRKWNPPVFITTLSSGDLADWGEGSAIHGDLEAVTSKVSADGRFIVFMSEGHLTGYDNADANSGEADEEVYLYDSESRRLRCISCNPTGERPTGVVDSFASRGGEGLLVDEQNNWKTASGRWLAGMVPGWTAMKSTIARYQPRYLLDDGRVFFESADALVPQDTNGLMDVYEYEPEGVPAEGPYTCTTSSPTFGANADGCVGLISSGTSGEESVFLDASGRRAGTSGRGAGEEEGEDVFFLTSAPLVAMDKDTAFDVYDAHVCSGWAPCPTEVVSPPPCMTAESCKEAPSPQPLIFGASGSATFSGAGNLAQSSATAIKCLKDKKLSRGKCIKTRKKKKSSKKKRVPMKAGSKRRAGR